MDVLALIKELSLPLSPSFFKTKILKFLKKFVKIGLFFTRFPNY
jgi:hypothetical protein